MCGWCNVNVGGSSRFGNHQHIFIAAWKGTRNSAAFSSAENASLAV